MPIPFLYDPNNPDDSYCLGFSISKEVRKKLDDFGPTVVHITVPDVTCLHMIQYARDRKLPLMGTYHSNIPDYFTHYPGLGWLKHIIAAYERHVYNFLQALFVPTPFIRRHLTVEDHYRFDKITDLKVWGRGVDLERFHPSHRCEKFRARFGFTPDDVVVTWVGRLVPEKRPDIFAYVVRKLTEEGINFKALVVGSGPCEGEVKSLPNTSFAGWVTGDELAVAYASSDVFLFPSAVETFGNVTLEAAASGLPLVVDSGCSGHLVQHGVNGFACKEGDVESYYNGTLSLVLDNSRRKTMSKEGRQLSLRFEKRTVCRKMIDNYSAITKEFYGVYGGDHENRDREYENKPDSFLGGSYLRPTSLILVQYIFIVVFQVAYRIAKIIFSIKGFMASIRSRGTHHSTASAEAALRTTDAEPLSSFSSKGMINTSVVISAGLPGSQDSLADQETATSEAYEMEESTCGGDTDSADDSTYGFDDASSSSCSSASIAVRKSVYEEQLWRSNLAITHNLAILFIKSVRAQGRIECFMRKRYERLTLAAPSNDWLITGNKNKRRSRRRKRKCSEEFTPDDLALALQLQESLLPVGGSSCSSTDSTGGCSDQSLVEDIDASTFTSRSYSDHGLNSRRVRSSSTLQV
eukprot:CAMPEP_0197282412 /NCGR_PEP_ID=MMETSP1432-20130617/24111_1 /TAXON_ID=44447 /ORGANISM="Pseudo-nitzschia delicatissima, Strain UNC1205" /LENGTH=634 /DNA_ID=CAMNT_0042749341 /DNA_START=206 /DNA_END=2110 /DNA_ORIENTATION=-